MDSNRHMGEKNSIVNVGHKRTYVLVDALNGAFSRNDGRARLSDLLSIRKRLKNDYAKIEIIADASARHKIDNKSEFESHVKKGEIILCPAGIDADDLIWARAKTLWEADYEVSIVSNDMFPVKKSKIDKIPIRSVTVSIFNDGEIYFLSRNQSFIRPAKKDLTRKTIPMVKVGG